MLKRQLAASGGGKSVVVKFVASILNSTLCKNLSAVVDAKAGLG